MQLSGLKWPAEAVAGLRLWTSSGGHLPDNLLRRLQAALPAAKPVLMYGLTEAFRSTWLPPAQLAARPGSMGQAIPGVQLLVVDAEGRPCQPGEVGQLVHLGALVSQGYWRQPQQTAERFRQLPQDIDPQQQPHSVDRRLRNAGCRWLFLL